MSSPRSLADARNRVKIAAALQENPLVKKAIASGQVGKELADALGKNVVNSSATNIVQSAFGKSGLSAATIKAQQELAEKFGIVTFDVEGNISTVPQTRPINEDIFVGTGRFTDSAFKKSIEVLQGKSDPLTNFSNGVNDIILKPIIKAFDEIFTNRNIDTLPVEQKARVLEIDARLAELGSQLIPVPPCTSSIRGAGFQGNRQVYESVQNCTEHDAAVAFNRPIEVEQNILNAEKDGIFKVYQVLAGFNKQLIDQTEILNRLIKENPLTASLKAEIGNQIQIASKLIEEILTKQIEVEQKNLATLQTTMVAGAHRMSEQVSAGAETANGLADVILNGLSDFGKSLGDLGGVVDAIVDGIATSFDKIFNPSVEDILEKQKKMHEYQITEYAKFLEDAQKFLARGSKA